MVMGAIYFVVMACGALGFRVSPMAGSPKGWTPPAGGRWQVDDHAPPRASEPRVERPRSSG
jgi:hypothetical protein